MWTDALEAKYMGERKPFGRPEFDQLLGHYSAVSADLPFICFAEELIHAYPDAKPVLVDRDIDSWYKSYSDNVISAVQSPFDNFVANIDRVFVGRLRRIALGWTRVWLEIETEGTTPCESEGQVS